MTKKKTENQLTMNTKEVALVMFITPKTLLNKKSSNDDIPPPRKCGKKLIWLRKDVEAWLENLPIAA